MLHCKICNKEAEGHAGFQLNNPPHKRGLEMGKIKDKIFCFFFGHRYLVGWKIVKREWYAIHLYTCENCGHFETLIVNNNNKKKEV